MSTSPAVTLAVAEKLGLLPEEFDRIKQILGRTPNFTELSVFGLMWSERCSYKNSILPLRTLPREGKNVVAGAGEAGHRLMDMGDGLAVAFKVESCNHASAIEPYQGAASGLGSIHSYLFSLGARPLAALNSLRFGDLNLPGTKHQFKGVVQGIGDYGNALGLPTVAGEAYFDPCYNHTPLVTLMSVGLVDHDQVPTATAMGIGNPVFIVGPATGKDGIHGLTFASEAPSDGSVSDAPGEKGPSVPPSDAHTEKWLMEATLEAIATGGVAGVRDIGAGGIGCATCEMSAKGKVGMRVWLDKVPARQDGMQPFELLLSESPQRMLFVVEKGKEAPVLEVLEKWNLHGAQLGEVTDTGRMAYYLHGELVGDIPAESLLRGGGAPVYEREQEPPAYLQKTRKFNPRKIEEPTEHAAVVRVLLSLPSIASKRWVREQYGARAGAADASSRAPSRASSDGAIIRIHGRKQGLVVSVDGNARYVYADPRVGCALAVAESARNIVCAGGTPLGVMPSLNFGDPYQPEVYWQFAQAIEGLGEACRMFDMPVTGEHVSFYNQSEHGPVFPTPIIGMVGLIDDVQALYMSSDFKEEGDQIYLLGYNEEDVNSSAYLYHYHRVLNSPAPYLDLEEEQRLQAGVLQLIQKKLIRSAHDVSDGGLIVSLLESAFERELGFAIDSPDHMRKDAFLYGEAGGRVVVSVSPDHDDEFILELREVGLECLFLGVVEGREALVDEESLGSVADLKQLYEEALEHRLHSDGATVY